MFISFGYLQKLVIYKKKEQNLIASIVQYNELSKAKYILCHYTVRTVYGVHYTLYSLVTLVLSCIRHHMIQDYFGVQGRVVHSSSTINANVLFVVFMGCFRIS